jgi:hypothetical protein
LKAGRVARTIFRDIFEQTRQHRQFNVFPV